MLFLVLPDRTMKWIDLPGSIILDLAKQPGVDLGRLDWLHAERGAEDDVVRVALRYGIVSGNGVVVDAGHVYLVRRPAELRATFREGDIVRAKAAPQLEAVDQFLDENLAPGWIDERRALDARVNASLQHSLAEAEAEAEAEVDAQVPRSDLTAHWKALGGILPNPV